jgi:AraC-like DNA-binding protein
MRASYLASYVYALRTLGIDPNPMLERQALPTAFELLPDYMVAALDVHSFVEDAAAAAAPGVVSTMAGFHNARCQPNPFREGASHASSLLDAIERHNGLTASYGPGSRFAVQLGEQQARWSKTSRSPLAETEIFCVASLVGHVRAFTHARWLPELIEVGVAAPEHLSRQPEFAEVRIGTSKDCGTHICFPLSDVRAAPPRLCSATASDPQSANSQEPEFLESLRLLMKGLARTGSLSVGSTARAARISVRTLQRRLREKGVSYSELAEQVRLEVSCDLLTTAHEMTVTEIGLELGYQDPGSFSRAFRRFTGMPPGEFRRTQVRPERPPGSKTEISTAAAVPR